MEGRNSSESVFRGTEVRGSNSKCKDQETNNPGVRLHSRQSAGTEGQEIGNLGVSLPVGQPDGQQQAGKQQKPTAKAAKQASEQAGLQHTRKHKKGTGRDRQEQYHKGKNAWNLGVSLPVGQPDGQ